MTVQHEVVFSQPVEVGVSCRYACIETVMGQHAASR